MTWDSLFQMNFYGQGGVNPSTIYIDNVYFYREASQPEPAPTTDAPTQPAREAGDVISINSDASTKINITNVNKRWGKTDTVEAANDPNGAGQNTKAEDTHYQYKVTE